MKRKKTGLAAAVLAAALLAGCVQDSKQDFPVAEEYFTFAINGQSAAVTAPADTLGALRNGSVTTLYGRSPNARLRLSASFSGNAAPGTYPLSDLSVFRDTTYYVRVAAPAEVIVISYGAPGGFITGTYSGALRDSTGTQTYSVNGSFRLKRKD